MTADSNMSLAALGFAFVAICACVQLANPVVPKVCSADPQRSAASFRGIRGYISTMANLKFTDFLVKGILFS
jgi:hypothetical protein